MMDLSAAIDQLYTAATESTAQRTKDSATSDQTVHDAIAELSAVVEYVAKVERHARCQSNDAIPEACR